jgi:hypothetical protein
VLDVAPELPVMHSELYEVPECLGEVDTGKNRDAHLPDVVEDPEESDSATTLSKRYC